MKDFENKETDITNEKGGKMSYADLGIFAIRSASGKGTDLVEMNRLLKVIDKLEKLEVGKQATLEDEEYKVLVAKVKQVSWTFMHTDLVNFGKSLDIPVE